MHCLRAAVALMAAMTFSLTALGQTPRAAEIASVGKEVIRPLSQNPVAGIAPLAGTMVKRQTETIIAGLTEIKLDGSCAYIDHGEWTVDKQPMFGTTSTRVESGISAGPNCVGHKYDFAIIFYTWTAHNNHTTTPNQGPTDIFNATWKSPAGCTNNCDFIEPFVFHIVTNPVRPRGETTTLESWLDNKGIWKVTLVCCAPPDKDDAAFDFSGETVNEHFLSDQNSCPDIGPAKESKGPVHDGPPGIFHDRVGYSPCSVHYERCIKKSGCGYVIKQQMEINSPADPPDTFFAYGSAPNTLSQRIEGSIIVNLAGKLTFRSGAGIVTSQRSTPLSQNDPIPHEFPSSISPSCFAGGSDFILYLRMLNSPC
jgi:hypothetical protein